MAKTDSGVAVSSQSEDEFQKKVEAFVTENAAMFDVLTRQASKEAETRASACQPEKSYKYAEPEALEFHMNVDRFVREERLFQLVKPGDILEGHVTSKEFRELTVRVTSFVGSHKFREMADIDIYGRVGYENLSDKGKEREKIFDEMQLRDVVQGVVVGRHGDVLSLSFRESHVEQLCPNGHLPIGARLGYRSGKVPLSGKQLRTNPDEFLSCLEDDSGFSNPSCSDNLKILLGIRAEYPSSDCYRELRKVQRSKWSMDTVATGVKCFKAGEHSKAIRMLDHALSIDPDNVEGLVARGALYANGGRFKEGIRDFEKALTLKHTHRNAKKYLVETQVAYGEDLEKNGHIEGAMKCYREALADDPDQTMARERLQALTVIAERKAAEQREKERKKLEEEKKLRKIQKFLDKEREKKSRKVAKKGKKKKTKKQRRKTSSSKPKRSRKSSRRYTSSDSEDTFSESTFESDSSSRSRSTSSERSYRRKRSRDRYTSYSETHSDSSPPSPQKRRLVDADTSSSFERRSSRKKDSPSWRRRTDSTSSKKITSPSQERPSPRRDSHSSKKRSSHRSSLDSTSTESRYKERDEYSESRKTS